MNSVGNIHWFEEVVFCRSISIDLSIETVPLLLPPLYKSHRKIYTQPEV